MRIKKKILLIFLILSTGLLAVHSGVTGAQTLSRITANPEHVPWSQLTFGAKNFSVEVTAKVSLEKVPAAEVEAALIRSPQGTPFNPSQPEVYKLHVEKAHTAAGMFHESFHEPAIVNHLGITAPLCRDRFGLSRTNE